MVLARQIALDLCLADVPATSGAYLLGSTSPDIRVITRQDRLSTHFFDLNEHNHQDSEPPSSGRTEAWPLPNASTLRLAPGQQATSPIW